MWLSLALALTFAIVVHTWSSLEATCNARYGLLLAEIQKANGCFEFWLNRYQAMVAAILALVGAALTIHQMSSQARTQNRNEETAARIYFYSIVSDYLFQTMLVLNKCEAHEQFLRKHPSGDSIREQLPIFNINSEMRLASHLPAEISIKILMLKRDNIGYNHNIRGISFNSTVRPHLYCRGAAARTVVTALDILKELGVPIGIFKDALTTPANDFVVSVSNDFVPTNMGYHPSHSAA